MLDTNAYSCLQRADPRIVPVVENADSVWLSAIVIGELEAGFKGGSRGPENLKLLAQFLEETWVEVAAVTRDTARYYGQIDSGLRKRGKPLPRNDIWIAANCLEHGCLLLTLDRHFDDIEFLPRAPLAD